MKRNYLALLICLASVPATAEDLFPAGPESKSMGLASSLQSEGPPAVLYNPANLFVVGEKNNGRVAQKSRFHSVPLKALLVGTAYHRLECRKTI
jgi:hypothetical protein